MHHNTGTGKVCPRTSHEGPEGVYMYSSTVYLTWGLDGGGWSMSRPGRFTPAKDTVTTVFEQRQSEAWLPTYGLLTITEDVQSVHHEFTCRHGRRQTSGPISTTSDWDCLP